MILEKFITLRPYLYHLTDARNAEKIIASRTLICTNKLTSRSSLTPHEQREFVRSKRIGHQELSINGEIYFIRDQDPISMKSLRKATPTHDAANDFLEILNGRVFFWPTLKDLNTHYGRYKNEKPVILRFKTTDIVGLNPNPEFCKWNSGAPRCHPSYGGSPAPRNRETFRLAGDANYGNAQVREFTVLDEAQLPDVFEIGYSPDGPWKKVD